LGIASVFLAAWENQATNWSILIAIGLGVGIGSFFGVQYELKKPKH